MKRNIFALAVSVILAVCSQPACSAPITWTNISGGNWNVAANWNPNQVPASTDDAYITNNGAYSVTLNASATVASLTLGGASGTQSFMLNANTLTLNGPSTVGSNGALSLGGGTLGGAGSLAVNGPFTWSGGTIENTGGVTLHGTSSLNGAGNSTMALYGMLINAGQLTWSGSGANLDFNEGGTLTNLASGTITIAADVSNSVGNGTLDNAGLLTKTTTTGTTTLTVPFVNTSTVQVQSGTLNLNDGFFAGGTFAVSSGATLQLTGVNSVIAASSVTGAGTLLLSAGTLSGTGILTVNSPFTWSGGAIENTGGVTLNGTSSLNGAGNSTMELYGLLINAGQLTWSGSGANLDFNDGGILTNLASGTIAITADVSGSVGNGTLDNAGLLTKTTTAGTTALDMVVVNTGTISAQSGTISLTGGGTESGLLTNASGAMLNFGGGTHAVVAGFSAIGPGSLGISGGTVNFNNVAGSAVPNLALTGGVLGGSGLLAINGPFNWSGGTIENTGGVTLNGTSSLNGAGNSTMELYGLLINAGQLTWSGSGANLDFNDGGILTNLASGTITIAADVSNSVGNGTLGNAGLLTKTTTTGTTTLDMVVVNTGTISAQSGTISLTGSHTLTGGTLNFGINSLTSYGQINLSGSAALTGTVSANLNNGYIPIATNVFTVLTYGSQTGIFTSTILPFADAWHTNYTATNFSLTALNARPIIFTGTIPVKELTTLTTNVVSDLDIPAQALTSSLFSAPNGMTINPTTGIISWTPAQTNSPSTNTVTVIATDNGTPPLSAPTASKSSSWK